MTELDNLYAMLLQYGLLAIRKAIQSKDDDWAELEVEMLHNIPSLLGENNVRRHQYFWLEERRYYINLMEKKGSNEAKSFMQTFYQPIWDDMEPFIVTRNVR